MGEGPLWAQTAQELSALYRKGAATPEQALDSVMQRIEEVNPALNAVVTLDLPGARDAAQAAGRRIRSGQAHGPLDGVPITVKDNLFVQGLRATWGSRLFADFIAERDDLPVARLRRAGVVIVGKTNTPELALSGYTDNPVFGATGNPWAPPLSPGGSSGGAAAAIASGCGPLAVATDAGGSIRRPSGHTGVAGLKPGLGRVPRRFGFPALAHDLQVIGPVARCVDDLRAAFACIAVPAAAPEDAPRRLRIGCFGTIGDAPVEPAVTVAFRTACAILRDLGHRVQDIAPIWDPEEANSLFAALSSAGVARVMAGAADWPDRVTPAIADLARKGATLGAADYVATLDRVAAFRWRLHDAVAGWDVIATPASPAVAWPRREPFPATIAGQPAAPRAASAFSTAINLGGLPAVVVPAPVDSGSLPAGLQLIGPMGAEEALLDLAAAFERSSPWPRLAPI